MRTEEEIRETIEELRFVDEVEKLEENMENPEPSVTNTEKDLESSLELGYAIVDLDVGLKREVRKYIKLTAIKTLEWVLGENEREEQHAEAEET